MEVFKINETPTDVSQVLTQAGFDFTGGITPEGVEVSADGKTVYVANCHTEDVSFLGVDTNGKLTRQGYLAVGVTNKTPDPTKGGNGSNLFATDEEVGLRWFFSSAYADDPPIAGNDDRIRCTESCGFCHWEGRQDGCQWDAGRERHWRGEGLLANKDISDNWPEWYEGLNNDFLAYASACNGEALGGERDPIALFPQPDQEDRFHAREEYVLQRQKKIQPRSGALTSPGMRSRSAITTWHTGKSSGRRTRRGSSRRP